MTRILFCGDLAGTGFGTVTQDLGRALIETDDLRFLSLNEQSGMLEEPFASRTMLIGNPDGYMSSMESDAARVLGTFTGESWEDHWTPEAIIVLGDYAAVRLLPQMHPTLTEILTRIPTFHYVPIEGVGLPPSWAPLWQIIRPVAMSKFGAEQIAQIVGYQPPIVYHGVNTDAFYPVGVNTPIRIGETVLGSKDACKAVLNLDPSMTWLFRADRHMPRKTYGALFRSVGPVLRRNPKVGLLIHCRTHDEGGNLFDEKSKLPDDIRERVMFTGFHDQYGGAPREVLAALYNAADIYVSTSAEGFGLTIAESLACGVPAVGLDYSAVPEVIGPAGITVPAHLIDNPYSHFWATPDEPSFSRAVERLVRDKLERRLMGAKGPRHIRDTFSWAAAAKQFSSLVSKAQSEAA